MNFVSHLSGKVLDVGCGIGDMLRFRPNTIGVDINPKTVTWCKEQGLEAYTMEPDMLPFDTDSFDALILDNVLEHIAEPRPLLTEAKRVLNSSGRLLTGVPGSKGYASDPDHKVYYDEKGLTNLLERNGFSCRKLLRMPLPFPGLAKHLRQYCLYGIFDVSHG